MSKYLLLVLINIPILTIGIISAIAHYKTKRTSRRRAIFEVILWISIGAGLVFIEPLYNELVKHNLTDSPSMSLFDVGLLTLIIFCLLLIRSSNERMSQLQKKISRMHENLAFSSADESDQQRSSK